MEKTIVTILAHIKILFQKHKTLLAIIACVFIVLVILFSRINSPSSRTPPVSPYVAPTFDAVLYTSKSGHYTISYPGWWTVAEVGATDFTLSNSLGTARIIILHDPDTTDTLAALAIAEEALKHDSLYSLDKFTRIKNGADPAYRAEGTLTRKSFPIHFTEIGIASQSGLYRIRAEQDTETNKIFDELLTEILYSFALLK